MIEDLKRFSIRVFKERTVDVTPNDEVGAGSGNITVDNKVITETVRLTLKEIYIALKP